MQKTLINGIENIHLVRLSLEDLPNDSNMYYGVKCTPGPIIICCPHLAISKTLSTTYSYAIFEAKSFQPRETCIQGCAAYEYIHKHYVAFHSKHFDWHHSKPFDLALQITIYSTLNFSIFQWKIQLHGSCLPRYVQNCSRTSVQTRFGCFKQRVLTLPPPPSKRREGRYKSFEQVKYPDSR